MKMRGVVSGAVGFAAGGLCVLAVLGAPAGAQSSSPGAGKFWKENAPVVTKDAAPSAPAAPAENLPSLSGLVRTTGPSVVNIFTTKKVRNVHAGMPFMNPFGIPQGPGAPGGPGGGDDDEGNPEMSSRALGSGFIVTSDGYIVTNNHVVADTDEIKVKLTDGRELIGRLIGRDPQIDIGLIKIDATGLPTASLGDSDKLLPGDWVLALGNPLGLDHSASVGIISGTGRNIGIGRYDALLQTDAAINPGNSGGPLFNLKGEVVGINTAIVGGANAIGFAIPINMAKEILPDLKEKGKAVRGQLGVLLRPIDDDKKTALGLSSTDGALIERVLPGSPADKAGIKPGDVIVKLDGGNVKEVKELQRAVARTRPGTEVTLTYVREGKTRDAKAKVVEYKEDGVALGGPEERPEPDAGAGKLGIAVSPVTPDLMKRLKLNSPEGVVVRSVKPRSAASEAGLQDGDVILEANRQKVANPEEFRDRLKSSNGKPVLLLVQRDGETIFLVVGSSRSPGISR